MMARVHVCTRDQIIATWQNVMIVVYRVETTIIGARATQKVFDDLSSQYPAGAFVLTIVEESAPMPTSEVRAMVARMLLTRAPHIVLSAVVFEGSGFRATAVRSLVTGLALVSKLPYRHKVFSTVVDARNWLATNSTQAAVWGAGNLGDVVAELRSHAGVGG